MIHELASGAWPTLGVTPLAIIPLGATEQHGPHLPFDVDTRIADAVARGLAEQLTDSDSRAIVVTPALAFGASGEHQGFPGTSSIGEDALGTVIVELVRSVATWAGSVLIVNGHGGNLRALSTAVTQLREEKHSVAWLPCAVAGADAHAGRTETSIMLQLAPNLVAMDLAAAGNTAPMSSLLPELIAKGTRAVSPSGVLGDPTGATAAEGSTVLAAMIAGAVRRFGSDTLDERGCLVDPGFGDPEIVDATTRLGEL